MLQVSFNSVTKST